MHRFRNKFGMTVLKFGMTVFDSFGCFSKKKHGRDWRGGAAVAERSGAMEGLGPRNPGKPFAKKSAARRKFRT